MNAPRKLALFGGTFDPVHLGHIHLAKLAREELALDEVRFVPCQISPHKSRAPASAADRLEMLRIATAHLPWAAVDELELRRQGPSFSYQTAAAMADLYPGSRLFWIMGNDQWQALPQWRHPEKLAQCVEFIVFTRGAAPQAREGYRLHVVAGEHPASATAIRREIAEGVANPPWLDPAVARFIREKGLYGRA